MERVYTASEQKKEREKDKKESFKSADDDTHVRCTYNPT